MSTRGGDTSGWGSITDAGAMANGVNKLHIMIIRARDGYRDDVQYQANLKKCLATVTDLGALLIGTYAFTAYHNAQDGLTQAKQYWALINGGGAPQWQLPPTVDAERHSYRDENGVMQTWPMPTNPQDYLDTYVLPQINYLTSVYGQRPLFYSGPDFILNYLRPVLLDPKNKAILECRLWIAAYTNSTVGPTYWDRVKVFWPKWFLWQYKGDVSDWPGVSDLDLLRFPGTRAQLKACLADPSLPPPDYDPVYNPGGAIDPIPETDTWVTVMGEHLNLRHTPGDIIVDGEAKPTGEVIGVMNIGASFKMLESYQGEKYFWVRLDSGWVATGDKDSGLALLDER